MKDRSKMTPVFLSDNLEDNDDVVGVELCYSGGRSAAVV